MRACRCLRRRSQSAGPATGSAWSTLAERDRKPRAARNTDSPASRHPRPARDPQCRPARTPLARPTSGPAAGAGFRQRPRSCVPRRPRRRAPAPAGSAAHTGDTGRSLRPTPARCDAQAQAAGTAPTPRMPRRSGRGPAGCRAACPGASAWLGRRNSWQRLRLQRGAWVGVPRGSGPNSAGSMGILQRILQGIPGRNGRRLRCPFANSDGPAGPAGTTIKGRDGGRPHFEYTIAAFAA